MTMKPILLTRTDQLRIQLLLSAIGFHSPTAKACARLRVEIDRAVIVPELPPTTVGLGSTAEVRDIETGDLDRFTLTLPQGADAAAGRLSVLSPLGVAILGFSEGDEFAWEMPGGIRHLRLERVTQPEAVAIPAVL